MAFFALLWKARTVEKYRLNYEKEKYNSIMMGSTRIEQTFSQKWRHYRYDTQERISRTIKKWYPDGSGVSNFILYLKTDQTFLNFLLKSLMGFVGGIILTYLCFMFFVFQLSISLIHATIMSSIIGVLLTLGLAFSYRIRCLVFLLIPQFFSRVGRYTLTCYALVLILTGPATNTLKNSEVLSESMACTQEQIKVGVHRLNNLTQKPYVFMKDPIKLMIKRLKGVTTRVKMMVVRLNRLMLSIVAVIQHSFTWLKSISDTCNVILGSPYNRCFTLLQEQDNVADYKIIKPNNRMFLNSAYLAQAVCEAVKPFKTFSYVTDLMDEAIIASIRKKMKNFVDQISTLFHLEIHVHHSYSYSNNSTRSASQIAAGIVTEIRNRADPLLTWLSWSSYVTSLFLLLIIFRAKHYQHMYETRSRFDNRYITKELQELDLTRKRQGRETVLPLNRIERAKYITTTSFRLVASEKVYLARSVVFMAITTFKLLIHMVADYSLYWVLMTIRHHGKQQTPFMPGVPESGVYVTGAGFLARLFTSIVNTLNIPLLKHAPSPIPCLPDPYPPDFRRYTQIGVLIVLLWFFALFEPYGLRLRHLIMGQYRPERAKARATWLYNHILRTRAGFMKFARRKLHRQYKYYTESSYTFAHWLDTHIPFQCIKYLLGIGPQEPYCLLCGTTQNLNDADAYLTRCKTPKCPGLYCSNCFSDIGNLCTICLSPSDYGDLSDVSLEKGSSDDDDSDSESGSLTNCRQRTFLTNSMDSITKSNTRNRFFSKIFKKDQEDSYSLLESANFERRNLHSLYLAAIVTINLMKYYSKMQNICYINGINGVLNSLGINTEIDWKENFTETKVRENCSNKTTIYFNRLVRRGSTIYIYRRKKEKIWPSKDVLKTDAHSEKVTNVSVCKTKNNIRESKRYRFILNRNFTRHRLIILNFKRGTVRHRRVNNVTIKTSQGIINAYRFFTQKKNQFDSTNNNKKNSSKDKTDKNNCNNKKPIDRNTLTENDKTTKENNKEKSAKEKSKKEISKGENSKNIKTKTTHHKKRKFHNFFFKPWNHIKSNPNHQINTDTVKAKQKKDHKRRKKRKRDDTVLADKDLKEKQLAKKNSKHNRNCRIAAFLADLDWMKKDYKIPDVTFKEIDDSCRKLKPSCQFLREKSNMYKNKLVAMVQLSNIPFQWREAQREHCHCGDKACKCTESTQKFCSQKQPVKKAMHKLKLKANKAGTSPPASLVQKMISTVNVVRKVPIEIKSSICLPKRLSFYRSFRNEVMNQNSGIIDTDVLFKNDEYYEGLIAAESNLELHESSTLNKIISSSSEPAACQLSLVESIDRHEPKTLVATRCKCDYDDARLQRKRSHTSKPPVPEGVACPGRISPGDLSPVKFKKPSRKRSPLPSPIRKLATQPKKKVSPPPKKKISPPPPKKKPSASKIPLRVRMKHICSSIFGSGCTEKTCPNQKERDRRLERDRLCQSKSSLAASKHKDRIPKKNPDCREKCLPSNEFDDVELEISSNIKRAMEIARCKERELEKIKEIHRHIEKEQEIEKQIEMEQARHREREKEIERELGLELARHRQREKNLMCDEDSQTLPSVASPPVEPPTPPPCPGVVKQYCTTATQDSGSKFKKASKKSKNATASVDAVICMCDEKVGSDAKRTCTCATQYVQSKKSSSDSRISCGISPSPTPAKPLKQKLSPICPVKQTCVQVSSINCKNSTPHSPKSGWISPCIQHSMSSIKGSLDDQSLFDEPWQYDDLHSTSHNDISAGALSPKTSKNRIAHKLRSTANAVVSPIRKHMPKLKESGNNPRQSPVHIKVSAGLTYTPRFRDTSVFTKCSPEFTSSSNKNSTNRRKHYSTLSQITSPVAISTTHSSSNFTTMSKPKKSHRAEFIRKNTNIMKNDQGTENQTSHKGTHCSSLWKRVCRKNKVDARQNIGRRHKLSLESSLNNIGNQSTFHDLLTETNSETSVTSSSLRSDTGTRTDTTVCSMATVDYDFIPRRTLHNVKAVTKSNQATSTERAKLCHTGTLTYDWWSPIIERRPENITLEKKKGYNILEIQDNVHEDSQYMRQIKNSEIVTQGRVVKFKSRTQIIPTGMFAFKNEIMSPSRYLLESQKYYNELFAYSMSPPFGVKGHIRYQAPRIPYREKSQSVGNRRNHQRKTKRLDDCYSPRKQYSPRRRYTDSTRSSESPRKRPCSYRKNLNRYYLKLESGTKSFYSNGRI